jgi:hypothetical protein
MRIAALCGLVFSLAAGNAAAGDVYEPHAMLYFQVSFSGKAQDRKASYGLRLDQTYHARNETPEFRELLARPALAELRIGSDGVRSLRFAGTDFDRAYRVQRANGEEDPAGAPAAEESQAGETAAEEPATGEETAGEDEGRSLGEHLEEIPAGYLIGIAIGVVLLAGIGG